MHLVITFAFGSESRTTYIHCVADGNTLQLSNVGVADGKTLQLSNVGEVAKLS